MADYEVSAAYVDEALKPLREAGHLDAVLAELGPETALMVSKPWSSPWHRGAVWESMADAVVKVAGAPFFEEMIYQAVKKRFGPIVIPLLTSSLKKGTPHALFSRLEGLVDVAIRGVQMRWDKKSDQSGVLWIFYPAPVSPSVEHAWRGLLRYVFEITQKAGEVNAFEIAASANVLEFRVSWPA